MKRSPIRRDPEKAFAWLRKPRKPIRQRGRKFEREVEALAACRTVVLERSHGECEANVTIDRQLERMRIVATDPVTTEALRELRETAPTRPHAGSDVHHLWPEDRDRGVHDAQRVLYVCRAHHRWIHTWPGEASLLGLLRPHWG